ncbi:uncharacterized protein LOC128221632 [Mya arenaria]|nr:uncharacterized protein LOC128221632 [Mya arenaria]
MELKPSEIYFSQDSINNVFGKRCRHSYHLIGESLDAICENRCNIHSIPTISVMKKNGRWITSDNRRLWVFRQLERLGKCKTVPVHTTDHIPAGKMTALNSGDSVRVRGNPGGRWHLKPKPKPVINQQFTSYSRPSSDIHTPLLNRSYLREHERNSTPCTIRPYPPPAIYGYTTPVSEPVINQQYTSNSHPSCDIHTPLLNRSYLREHKMNSTPCTVRPKTTPAIYGYTSPVSEPVINQQYTSNSRPSCDIHTPLLNRSYLREHKRNSTPCTVRPKTTPAIYGYTSPVSEPVINQQYTSNSRPSCDIHTPLLNRSYLREHKRNSTPCTVRPKTTPAIYGYTSPVSEPVINQQYTSNSRPSCDIHTPLLNRSYLREHKRNSTPCTVRPKTTPAIYGYTSPVSEPVINQQYTSNSRPSCDIHTPLLNRSYLREHKRNSTPCTVRPKTTPAIYGYTSPVSEPVINQQYTSNSRPSSDIHTPLLNR